MGPPLRPWPFDTMVLCREVLATPVAGRVVVLGLTPETVSCGWSCDTELIAIDHSAAMLASLWPQAGAPARAHAVQADWLNMPLGDGVAGLVCADGCHTQVTYPHGFGVLAAEVRRVLRQSGRFVARVFLRLEKAERVDGIAQDYADGRIESVNVVKLRLLAALHGQNGYGSCLGDVWTVWKNFPPLPKALQGVHGWTDGELIGIERYRGPTTRYYLPTMAELRAVHTGHFDELACYTGDYALAERCPTLVWQRKP